jgi:hypothetical protein
MLFADVRVRDSGIEIEARSHQSITTMSAPTMRAPPQQASHVPAKYVDIQEHAMYADSLSGPKQV